MLTVTDYAAACKGSEQNVTIPGCFESPVLMLIAEKMGEKRFDLWFGQDTQCECSEEKITFYVRNEYAVNSIRRLCHQEIDEAVFETFSKKLPVEFLVKPVKKAEPAKTPVIPSIPVPVQANTSPFGQLFKKPEQGDGGKSGKERIGRRFASRATFLEGVSNNLACRAADLAIYHPGQINPIYVFGPTSVGKTHILEGIWSAVRSAAHGTTSGGAVRRTPLYMTADQFLSSFLETIRSGSVQDRNQNFRSKFKGISHLLLDDIQIFARASATQTELLQVFDLLRNQSVQLVFTGDRPLKDLPLQNELICRLESGMVCEIKLPERELALRICERMGQQRELPMDAEVCRLIASRFGVHARQISGALNRLHAVYLTSGKPITVAVAEEALGDLLRLNRRDIRLKDIGKIVCETFGISEETLCSKSRIKQIATPRMLAMWLARKYTRSALSEIGLYFGNLTHSSVISAQQRIDRQISNDSAMAETVQKIEQTLNGCM